MKIDSYKAKYTSLLLIIKHDKEIPEQAKEHIQEIAAELDKQYMIHELNTAFEPNKNDYIEKKSLRERLFGD